MEQGLQKLNAENRLAEWTRRIAECRSSGVSVRQWCQEHGCTEKTYYYWQRRIFKLAQEQKQPEFAEISNRAFVRASSYSPSIVATVEIQGARVHIHPGADEQTLGALLRALSSC